MCLYIYNIYISEAKHVPPGPIKAPSSWLIEIPSKNAHHFRLILLSREYGSPGISFSFDPFHLILILFHLIFYLFHRF